MIGAQVGPYRIESELGAGGMGSVYLAEVVETTPLLGVGERVALKIVHPHLLATPGFFKRFLQEADVGKRIQHPNVVRTYEVDATLVEDKQVNYMAMEYVEGRSLRQLLLDLGTVPETLLREIAAQVAAGLTAIHDAGIVHRDLKPENVLITDGQQVRIMDLGVAKLQEASIALTREGQFTGSLLYASPEQCEAQDVGNSADLYSLGVVLYELATGTNPFRRDDAVGIIKAHISVEPQRASDLSPDLSLFFTEVIGTLLAKKPEERFVSAEELGIVIEQGENSDWWAEREKQIHKVIADLPAIQVARETALHGRETEMAALTDAWNRVKGGAGGVILLEGEAGLGKSRLVDAFMRSLAGQDAHILYGSYPPSGGMGGISDSVLGKFGSSQLEESLAPYLTITPSLIPAFAALVRHESPPTGSEPLQGDALHSVCSHLVRALAKEAPTLWILDDISYAPVESRRILLAMARAITAHPVLLLFTSRPGTPEDELAHFSRLDHFRKMTLERLSPRQVIELLQDLFKSEGLAEKLGGKIAYKSDGVPYFVIELVRGLKDSSLLKQLPNGSYIQTQQITDIEVPSAVKDLIAGRLRELTKEERAILDVGAVQGFEFDPDLVARVREMKRVQVLETLADLERTRGIVRGVGRRYRFDQNQIHEVVFAETSQPLREEYHKLIAEAYIEREDLTPEDAEGEEALFIAQHLLKSDSPKRGLKYAMPALDHLESMSRHGAFVTLADLALPRLKGAKKVDLLTRKATALASQMRNEERSRAVEEAVALAEEIGDAEAQVKAYAALSTLHAGQSDHEAGLDVTRKAAEIARDAGNTFEEAGLAASVALHCWYLGRFDEAKAGWERAVELGREGENRQVEASAMGNLGYSALAVGRYADAINRFEEGLVLRKKHHRRTSIANAEESLGLVKYGLGDFDSARDHYARCVKIAREIGNPQEESIGLHFLGDVNFATGNLDAAMADYQASLAVRSDMGWTGGIAETRLRVGVVELQRGHKSQAVEHLDRAIELGEKSKWYQVHTLASCWRALLPGGDADAARKAVMDTAEKMEFAPRMEAHYVLWQVTGDKEQLAKAHEMLEHLREHAPTEYHESLMTDVPLHRDIAAAWARES
ncbi:MAG: protein kinase domain-containing protein [Planctomycetota bacterium]|jgi:predicted ATPase